MGTQRFSPSKSTFIFDAAISPGFASERIPKVNWWRGFTLIEVLVTLVIVVVSVTLILTHLRTLLDLHRRYQINQTQVSLTLNDVALLPTLQGQDLSLRLQNDRLIIDSRQQAGPLLEVRNFSMPGGDEISISEAYAPFQEFRVRPGSRYFLSLVRRGLPPP